MELALGKPRGGAEDRKDLPAPVGGEAEGRGGPCLSAGKYGLRPILSLHSSLLLILLRNRRELRFGTSLIATSLGSEIFRRWARPFPPWTPLHP